MTTTSTSLPDTRSSSPDHPATRHSTPPPPASQPIPDNFRSSLSAWWSNSSYKEARYAEERLLRRMKIFQASPPEPSKGWFGWSTSQPVVEASPAESQRIEQEQTTPDGLVATLRNVFVPTPNPDDAPLHPADPVQPRSGASSVSDNSKKLKCRKEDKLVDYINTMEISSKENAQSKEAVVVLHGYAAAMGFFFRNWESIAQSANDSGRRTFFLDWLGMGLSSRPSPSLLNSPSSAPIPNRVSRAEHFFLSSLESWRESTGVEKMVLIGHSLGGYLASAYAVRYPHRVSGLILVSPAGVPHGPEYERYAPTGEETNEGNLDQAADAAEMEVNQSQFEAKGEAKQWQKDRQESTSRKYMMKFFVWGWEKGVSPFSILRNMGPWAPMFAARYTQRRFGAQSEEDRRDIHAYIYNTSILKGSGEYCISHILAPGAYARVPIVDRIGKLRVPVTFMYGDNDWMDVDGGRASVEEMRKAGNDVGKVHVVPKAGHHLYLDNPDHSNRLIREAIEALPKITQPA